MSTELLPLEARFLSSLQQVSAAQWNELAGTDYHRDFVFERIGFNLEGSEVLAAFGLAQLSRLLEFINLRRRWFAAHADFFAAHEEHFVLPRQRPDVETAWMSFPVVVRDTAPFSRRALHEHLESAGVISRPIWTGNILRHPGFASIEHRAAPAGYPVADSVLRGGLLIAAHHGLDEADMSRIHDVLSDFLGHLS